MTVWSSSTNLSSPTVLSAESRTSHCSPPALGLQFHPWACCFDITGTLHLTDTISYGRNDWLLLTVSHSFFMALGRHGWAEFMMVGMSGRPYSSQQTWKQRETWQEAGASIILKVSPLMTDFHHLAPPPTGSMASKPAVEQVCEAWVCAEHFRLKLAVHTHR